MFSHTAGQSRDDAGGLVTAALLTKTTQQQVDSMKSGAAISVSQLTFCIEIEKLIKKIISFNVTCMFEWNTNYVDTLVNSELHAEKPINIC